MLLGGVAGGVYQPQHESSAASSSTSTTSSSTTATIACAVQVIDKTKVDYSNELCDFFIILFEIHDIWIFTLPGYTF